MDWTKDNLTTEYKIVCSGEFLGVASIAPPFQWSGNVIFLITKKKPFRTSETQKGMCLSLSTVIFDYVSISLLKYYGGNTAIILVAWVTSTKKKSTYKHKRSRRTFSPFTCSSITVKERISWILSKRRMKDGFTVTNPRTNVTACSDKTQNLLFPRNSYCAL